MPAFSMTPTQGFPQPVSEEFPNPLIFADDGVDFQGPITRVDFTGGAVTADSEGTLTVPLGGGGGGGYNAGPLIIAGQMKFGGTDGYSTYRGYGTDSNNPATSLWGAAALASNVVWTNDGNGPMLLDEGTWQVTVFVTAYGAQGGPAAGAQPNDAPKVNVEIQSPFGTMDNIVPIPVGCEIFTATVTSTVVTAGPSNNERTLIIRSFAQWDVVGNAGNQYDAACDFQVFLTKLAQAPVYV